MNEKREINSYPKCIYKVIAVPIINHGDNIHENMSAAIIEIPKDLGYGSLSIAFVNLLLQI